MAVFPIDEFEVVVVVVHVRVHVLVPVLADHGQTLVGQVRILAGPVETAVAEHHHARIVANSYAVRVPVARFPLLFPEGHMRGRSLGKLGLHPLLGNDPPDVSQVSGLLVLVRRGNQRNRECRDNGKTCNKCFASHVWNPLCRFLVRGHRTVAPFLVVLQEL